MTARFTIAALVERFGGTCSGALDRIVTGFNTLDDARPDELAFVNEARYDAAARTSRASAILVNARTAERLARDPVPLWICSDPYLQFARIAQVFEAARRAPASPGVHPTATIDATASIDASATIGAYARIGPRVRIGANTSIGAHAAIDEDSVVGDDGLIHAHVSVYRGVTIGARAIVHSGAVIGSDGFGFAKDGAAWVKIPQTGSVVIGDDVEIGANTTIDRGALGPTVIGHGVKLDNQIQVAHNVRIGDHTVMAAFVGIAGSAVIGARCMIGGAARIMGHVSIADDVVISTQTFVSRSIARAGHYTGYYPMSEHASFEKNAAVLRRLDGLRDRVRTLEKSRTTHPDTTHDAQHAASEPSYESPADPLRDA